MQHREGRMRVMVRSIFGSIAAVVNRSRAWSAGAGYGGTRHLSPITVESAQTNATVATCVDTIARQVGQLTFTAPERDPNGPINRVLRRPNDYQGPFTFFHGLVEDLLYHGNSAHRLTRGRGGAPMFISPMDPQHVRVVPDEYGRPHYRTREFPGLLGPREVIHIRDGGGHEVWARSRLSKGGIRIMALWHADRLIQDTFENGISIQYWVNSTRNLGADGAEKLIEMITAAYGETGARRGGVAVLEGADLKTIPGLKPADADLRALRQDLIREIAALFAVPPFLAGGTGDVKYSNVTARMLAMYRETIVPIVINIQEAFSLAFGARIDCDVSGLLSGDLKTQIATAVQATGGPVLTPNEGRALVHGLGLAALEGEENDRLRAGGGGTPAGAEAEDPERPRAGEQPTDDGATDPEAEKMETIRGEVVDIVQRLMRPGAEVQPRELQRVLEEVQHAFEWDEAA